MNKLTDLDFLHQMLEHSLANAAIQYRTEKDLQDMVHHHLDALFPNVRREHAMENERPDFTVGFDDETVFAVEVKTRCPRMEILRQLKRYNNLPYVRGTLLVCIRPVRGLPDTLSNKPVKQLALFAHLL